MQHDEQQRQQQKQQQYLCSSTAAAVVAAAEGQPDHLICSGGRSTPRRQQAVVQQQNNARMILYDITSINGIGVGKPLIYGRRNEASGYAPLRTKNRVAQIYANKFVPTTTPKRVVIYGRVSVRPVGGTQCVHPVCYKLKRTTRPEPEP